MTDIISKKPAQPRKNRILCIGDIHGDWKKLKEILDNTNKHGRVDVIFQLGDFGLYPEIIDSFRYTVDPTTIPLFTIGGNHEVPESYPKWEKVLKDRGMRLTERGEYFPKLKLLCIGGASHAPWEVNLPMRARENTIVTPDDICKCYEHKDKEVDIILSHDAPCKFIGNVGELMLDYLLDVFKPKLWLSAHHHKTYEKNINGIQWYGLDVYEEKLIEL